MEPPKRRQSAAKPPRVREVARTAIEKWSVLARSTRAEKIALPIDVLAEEASVLAHFVDRYWEPHIESGKPVPGLSGAPGLKREIAAELRELRMAMMEQAARYRMLDERGEKAPVRQGRAILNEIRATLAFLFASGASRQGQARLAQFERAHARAATHDGLALALDAYAHLAEEHRPRLRGMPDFDECAIDEARSIAQRLREHSGRKLTRDNRQSALGLRNRFATLLLERMRLVRAASRYVFRRHPETVRKATSAYERGRRRRGAKTPVRRAGLERAAESRIVDDGGSLERS